MTSSILFIGAHPDDIEIGCLGTIYKIDKLISLDFLICSGTAERKEEFLKSTTTLLNDGINVRHVHCLNAIDTNFTESKANLKKTIKTLLPYQYQRIYTHFREDLHQDHRVVSELTSEIFRESEILMYEIPKYDGCSFRPTVYSILNDELIAKKTSHILDHYKSQHQKKWFDARVFQAQARLRGVESNSIWAEAFMPFKLFF